MRYTNINRLDNLKILHYQKLKDLKVRNRFRLKILLSKLASTDRLVRNPQAFQVLLTSFVYPYAPKQTEASTRHGRPLPDSLREILFGEIKNVIMLSPINYFLVESTNAVPLLIESMENTEERVQVSFKCVLCFSYRF